MKPEDCGFNEGEDILHSCPMGRDYYHQRVCPDACPIIKLESQVKKLQDELTALTKKWLHLIGEWADIATELEKHLG